MFYIFCFFCQVFDTTRKITYKNLTNWYKELRQHRPEIPCVCGANKIDGEHLMRISITVERGSTGSDCCIVRFNHILLLSAICFPFFLNLIPL